MKKGTLILLFLLNACSISNAQQQDCMLIEDTFYLITLDVRAYERYPLVMMGLTKNDLFKNLKKENITTLLKSFYQNAYYFPHLPHSMEDLILTCLGDSVGYTYLKMHEVQIARLTSYIVTKGLKKQFELDSGETVYYSNLTITGSFWRVDKNHPGIKTTSSEIDIKYLQEVQDCYIPFEVNVIKRRKTPIWRKDGN
ncbi:MAG: hypothetical protein NW226_27525 [Microscillaceae bacterium]|nr:hypothetical protein [Microscillaceae bacterium]